MNVLSKQHQTRPKIAVIGAGWAGLSAAVHLGNKAEVHVFEASKQAGGRARTLAAGFADASQQIEERKATIKQAQEEINNILNSGASSALR